MVCSIPISRFCIILCLFSLSFKSNAQVQFACFAGLQATSAHYLVNDTKQPTQFKPGTMGGVAVKVEFDNQLYFFPSVYYSLKGYKVTLNTPAFPPSELAKSNDVTVHTVEVAPLLQYDFNKKPAHFFVRFGPSVDYGYYGRESVGSVDSSGIRSTVYRPMVFDFTEYGHFTAQANLHFGYETGKGLMMFAFYEHGFGSMNNHDGGPKIFHRIIGLSAGWLFGKNPIAVNTKK
jgi:hypothetical protein